jgi:hypothetical protein
MPSPKHKKRPRATFNPDHRRRTHVPTPSDAEIERRLDDFVKPAVFAELDYYRQLGLRNRLLNLPVMVSLVLALIWRRIPGVCALQRTLARERIFWAAPQTVSQSALSDRFLEFPAVLFERVLEQVLTRLPERLAGRSRPLSPLLKPIAERFSGLYALDATTLEPLFRKLDALQDTTGTQLAGHVTAALELLSHLPAKLWWNAEPHTNEKAVAQQVLNWLPKRSLLVFDLGYFAYWLFDKLSLQDSFFVTRLREQASYSVTRTLCKRPKVRDQIIQLGLHKEPCSCPMRLLEVQLNGRWQRYLTNVLDPKQLSIVDVVALYDARWQIETTFLLVKRLLDLSYVWVGSQNGIWLQVVATFLMYAILIDLCDDVAEALQVELEQISAEMVYRGVYHYVVAVAQGDYEGDAASYLARDAKGLGVLKRKRPPKGPSAIEQIRLALVAPPLPDADLTVSGIP